MKNRTNDFINQTEDNNPTDNATQNIVNTEKLAVAKAGDKLNEEGKKSVIKTKDNCEDAPNGIMAAFSAGTKPVMVVDLIEPTDEIIKMLFVNPLSSLLEVKELLSHEL